MKEPVYSRGDRAKYPLTSGYPKISYTDFLNGHLTNTKNILISQNLCNRKFSCIFAPTKLHVSTPATSWVMKSSYEDIQNERCEKKEKNQNIHSLACDEVLGFGCYFMSGYGDSQSIISGGDYLIIKSKIEKKDNEGMYILTKDKS